MTESAGVLRILLEVRSGLDGAMLEVVYRLVFVIAAIPWVLCTVLAFHRSDAVWGLVWAVVLGPAAYVVLVSGLRLALGFFVVLIKLMERLTELPAAMDRLTDQVGSLRGDIGRLPDAVGELTGHIEALPVTVTTLNEHIDSLQSSLDRAQFWRSSRRLRRSRDDDPARVSTGEPDDVVE